MPEIVQQSNKTNVNITFFVVITDGNVGEQFCQLQIPVIIFLHASYENNLFKRLGGEAVSKEA